MNNVNERNLIIVLLMVFAWEMLAVFRGYSFWLMFAGCVAIGIGTAELLPIRRRR